MAASPQPVFCAEKKRLLMAYVNAASEVNRMHSAQLAAVLKGESFGFEEQIAAAHERRDEIKYALLAHRQEHHC